jgi:hypothetical protein
MKFALALVVAGLFAAALGTQTAAAETATVSLASCSANGGSATVPAGSTVTLRLGNGFRSRGLALAFLRDVTVTASVDSTPVANPNQYWSAPSLISGLWVVFWTYPTGITLTNPGDSLTASFQETLTHSVGELRAGNQFNPALSCTVTAA